MDLNKILPVVLAGGKSKRFGEDKSQAKLGEKILIDYILSELVEEFKEVLIVANDPIKHIDVKGDSISIGGLCDRILGMIGYKTEYVEKVEADIVKLKNEDPEVASMITDLEESPIIHKIEPTDTESDGNTTHFVGRKAEDGIPQGSTINYNPDKNTKLTYTLNN